MSISFFISSVKPPIADYLSNYRIDSIEYEIQLKKIYPFANFVRPKNSTYLLTWRLNNENQLGVDGGLQNDSITISFSNGYWNTNDYILWHRLYIPETVPLYLFDENLHIIHLLTKNTTKLELSVLLDNS